MEQVLTDDKIVTTMKKSSKRRGPVRRKNFVQENIAFLRELETKLQEKNNDVTAVARTRRKAHNKKSSRSSNMGATQGTCKKHAQTSKHSARKGKTSSKFQPYMIDDNAEKLDIKLTAKEKLLLKGYCTQSSSDLLSNFSSTDNEPDIVEAAADDETGTAKTSNNSEENKSDTSLVIQREAKGSSKPTASIMQKLSTSPSVQDAAVNSLHHTFSATKQPSIKMTAKAEAAKQKVLAASAPDPLKAPPSYKRGVVPRYLRTQKKELQKGNEELFDPQQGFIPLPNDTRKEVLTLLRKSFADLAHQLNMLPIRPPNLEIRERRTDIVKQLDKLEEAILVFSQPEVSVKVALHKKSVKPV